jgi:hypothetical protein
MIVGNNADLLDRRQVSFEEDNKFAARKAVV